MPSLQFLKSLHSIVYLLLFCIFILILVFVTRCCLGFSLPGLNKMNANKRKKSHYAGLKVVIKIRCIYTLYIGTRCRYLHSPIY